MSALRKNQGGVQRGGTRKGLVMNSREREMLEILKRGREEFGYVAAKAEFEAEGTRIEELLRLVELARRADLNLGLKIGGCEALHDLMQSKLIGADYIIAPMVETSYALKKFIDAKNRLYSEEERSDTKFLFNLETISAFNSLNEIVETAAVPGGADGVVFGRVDFSFSNGWTEHVCNSPEVTKYCIEAAEACKNSNLEFVVGGGVGMDAIPALQTISETHLSRFETRKIIFSSESLNLSRIHEGLKEAVRFETLWLMNKRDYYGAIQSEDAKRITMLELRLSVLENASRI